MNTKGNTKSKKAEGKEKAEGGRQNDEGRMEAALYPVEFLHVMQDTMFEGLKNYLERSDAPVEAVGLLEDLQVLMTWKGKVDGSENQQVDRLVNDMLSETIASGSRHVVAIGSALHSPYGEMRKIVNG